MRVTTEGAVGNVILDQLLDRLYDCRGVHSPAGSGIQFFSFSVAFAYNVRDERAVAIADLGPKPPVHRLYLSDRRCARARARIDSVLREKHGRIITDTAARLDFPLNFRCLVTSRRAREHRWDPRRARIGCTEVSLVQLLMNINCRRLFARHLGETTPSRAV